MDLRKILKAKLPEGTPDACIEIEHQVANEVGGPIILWLNRPDHMRSLYVVYERLMAHMFSYCKASGPPFHSDVVFAYVMMGSLQCPSVTVRSAAYQATKGFCNYRSPAKDALYESYLNWKHTF